MTSQINRPRAILFDHDGVLVASEPIHWQAWGQLIGSMGLPFHLDDVRALVGKTGPQIMASLLDRYRPGWSRDEYDLDALALRKNDYYQKGLVGNLRAYPGVTEGLAWLREAGVARVVVSNAKRRELEAGLAAAGLSEFFDDVLSRDDFPRPKPDPTPYLMGAAAVNTEPRDCIVVEDSPPGLEAGLLAGIPTAAVLTNFPRAGVESPVPGRPDLRPTWIGESMVEFFAWIRSLPQA